MSKRKEKILGEIGFTYAGLSGKTQKDFGRGKPFIPFMNIMSNGKIDPKFMGLVEVAPNERQNSVQKGDLFFTTSSETPEEVGMTSVLLEDVGECYLNSFCFGFRLYNFDDLKPEFAPYLFRGNEVRKQIVNLGQGYTRFNLPKTELLKKLKLSLPSENEQKKISEILTKADSIIEKTQAAIAKYKAIKQGMLQDLFTRGIDLNTNKLRPRFEDAPELYKESKLGWIPREWEVLPVSSVSENLDGARIPVKQEDRDKQQEVYPYYGASGIIDYVEDYIFDESLILLGEDGENVISRNLPLAFKVSGKIWVNNHAHVLKPIPTIVTIDFLCEMLESINYSTIVSGTAQPKITQGALSEVLLPIPNMDEQLLMSERIVSITKKLQTEQTYLQKMQSLKKGLMEDLLSGRKCLNLDFQDEQINQDSKTILQSVNLVNQDADNYPVNPKIE